MNKTTIEDLTGVSDDALLAELERRRLTGEDLLRACKLGDDRGRAGVAVVAPGGGRRTPAAMAPGLPDACRGAGAGAQRMPPGAERRHGTRPGSRRPAPPSTTCCCVGSSRGRHRPRRPTPAWHSQSVTAARSGCRSLASLAGSREVRAGCARSARAMRAARTVRRTARSHGSSRRIRSRRAARSATVGHRNGASAARIRGWNGSGAR